MRIGIGVCVAALIATQAHAQTNRHPPAPSADEMHLAIEVGRRLAVLDRCGLDAESYPVYGRWRHFLASHRDELGSGTVENRARQGIALAGAIPSVKLATLCQEMKRAEAASALPKILDKLDEPLRKAHFIAGHIPHWDSEYKEMEMRFGAREVLLAKLRPKAKPVPEVDPEAKRQAVREFHTSISQAIGLRKGIGPAKSLIESITGADTVTDAEVSGIDPFTGEEAEGRCAFAAKETAKTVLDETLLNPSPTPRTPAKRVDRKLDLAIKGAVALIGTGVCAEQNVK